MAKKFTKQPAEVVDYYIDMTEYFEELEGDKINDQNDVTVTIEPVADLVAGTTVLVNSGENGFKQWFSGGTDGVTYKITYLVTTDAGRVEEIEMKIKVKET